MLNSEPLVAFVPATDLDRAHEFYAGVLGLPLAEQTAFTERYQGMSQDEDGGWTTPGGDQVAWFKDPDGNVLSLTQPSTGSSGS